ncbi:hypothetical protein OIU76_010851 [Salix suchowensis]|nr:hypothetical protein OIU76_010851 [Salix suchowensis]
MARQADRLYRIGLEGFALIDEWNGCPRRPSPAQEHQQQRYDYRGIQVPMTKNGFYQQQGGSKTLWWGGDYGLSKEKITLLSSLVIMYKAVLCLVKLITKHN